MSLMQTFRDGYRPYYGWKKVFARIWLVLMVIIVVSVLAATIGWKAALVVVGGASAVMLSIWALFEM